MKVVKIIIQYILAVVFALALLSIILINIASSRILNESYVLAKLEEENYYEEVYEEVKSNFEKYIYQSGLDESVLNDLVSKEKVESDTKLILNNIYDGLSEEVSTTSIAEKLDQNIQSSLKGNTYSKQKKAIEQFITKICEEYESTIINSKINSKVNPIVQKVIKYLDVVKKALYVVAGISIVLIIAISIKKIYKILARIGVALTIDGLLLLISEYYILSKVNIYGITVLGDSVSKVLRVILIDIFGQITSCGISLLIIGILCILMYSIIRAYRRIKRVKEQYTPEN